MRKERDNLPFFNKENGVKDKIFTEKKRRNINLFKKSREIQREILAWKEEYTRKLRQNKLEGEERIAMFKL